jgi:dTDP-4-dehydrorhamnose 3,5-epimerase
MDASAVQPPSYTKVPMPVKLFKPGRFGDDRGWFSETYNHRRMVEQGSGVVFVQDNHSLSRSVGTIRGLHFQAPPYGQVKLVRCIRGAIWDVAVDVRAGSPSYGKWVSAELSADNGHQLYIPVGFAHGFVTLTPDAEVIYKVSAYYDRDSEGGVAWNDPTLSLPWPLPSSGPVLSDKDLVLPKLADLESPFSYEGEPPIPLDA